MTVDVLHKATCVIQHWTAAEFTAAMAKVDIMVDKIPNGFEEDIPDGRTLYEQFTSSVGLQSMINDYFQSDELRPLVEKLWAHLTLIDDESKCVARRMFASLKPELTKLQGRQQDEDTVDENKRRARNQAQVGRSYGVAQNDDAQLSDSDNDSGGDGGGEGGGEDDEEEAGDTTAGGGETKRNGGGNDKVSLDLVTAAFQDMGLEDHVSKTKMKDKYYMLKRWVDAFESSDWKSMSMVCKEFVHTAANLGQRIIEDKVSMGDLRCFLPKNMGGIAGGKEFIEKGILIKFAGISLNASPLRQPRRAVS